MSNDSTQLAEFLRLYLRLKPYRLQIPMIAGAIAILLTLVWLLSYRATYSSEAIALIRPQQQQPQDPQDKEPLVTGLFPKPLGVADYTLLMKSDAILTAVANAYNEAYAKDDPENATNNANLRAQLTATSRLEIKTPYAVNYYPTIEMRADAQTAELAFRLMELWIGEVRKRAHEIAFSTKESVLEYLENEYQTERTALFNLQQELNATMQESSTLIEALRRERAALEEQYEVETVVLLNQTEDEWNEKVAAREAELNLPYTSAQIHAVTTQIESLQESVVAKEQEFAESKARLEGIARELQFYKDSPVADSESKLFWSVDVADKPVPQESDTNADILKVEIPSAGVNPNAVLLSRDASMAKVAVASLPQELEELTKRLDGLEQRVHESQAKYVHGDTEIVTLLREKEAQLQSANIEREYRLENLQRETEVLVLILTRERQAMEDQLTRDLETKSTMFASLAESRLQARLAVANTMDEFQIITGPSRPEDRAAVRVVGFFAVTFAFALLVVAGAILVAFVLTDTLKNLTAATHGKS